jgi:hypothetical protein
MKPETKQTETAKTPSDLTSEELTAIVGGRRQYNVYSNGGFYSGANVHSFNKKKR